jgi:hypothetical protein
MTLPYLGAFGSHMGAKVLFCSTCLPLAPHVPFQVFREFRYEIPQPQVTVEWLYVTLVFYTRDPGLE